eukprot:g80520.t1
MQPQASRAKQQSTGIKFPVFCPLRKHSTDWCARKNIVCPYNAFFTAMPAHWAVTPQTEPLTALLPQISQCLDNDRIQHRVYTAGAAQASTNKPGCCSVDIGIIFLFHNPHSKNSISIRSRSWTRASDNISISDKDDKHRSDSKPSSKPSMKSRSTPNSQPSSKTRLFSNPNGEHQCHRSIFEPRSIALEGKSQLKISGRRNSISRSITTSCARAFGMYEKAKEKIGVHIEQKMENIYSLRRVKDNYKIGSVIGKGSYATVHKITRRTDGVPFALKIMLKNWTNLPLIHVKKTLIYDHPYCVRIERVYETRKEYLMMMEYCSTDLHEALARMEKEGKHYSHDEVALVTYRVAQAQYIHSQGVVHRDLKPENILVTGDGRTDIKVADFGSAGILEGKECLLTIHGSPSYVAPEVLLGKGYGPKVLLGKGYGPKVDVWAVGVIVYRMLSRTLPFDAPSMAAKLQKIKKGEYSFPDDVWKTIDPTGEGPIDFIKKLLVVDPKQRLSAGDILLHPWVSEHVHPMDSQLPKQATPIVFPRTFHAYPTAASKEFFAGQGSVSFQGLDRPRPLRSLSPAAVSSPLPPCHVSAGTLPVKPRRLDVPNASEVLPLRIHLVSAVAPTRKLHVSLMQSSTAPFKVKRSISSPNLGSRMLVSTPSDDDKQSRDCSPTDCSPTTPRMFSCKLKTPKMLTRTPFDEKSSNQSEQGRYESRLSMGNAGNVPKNKFWSLHESVCDDPDNNKRPEHRMEASPLAISPSPVGPPHRRSRSLDSPLQLSIRNTCTGPAGDEGFLRSGPDLTVPDKLPISTRDSKEDGEKYINDWSIGAAGNEGFLRSNPDIPLPDYGDVVEAIPTGPDMRESKYDDRRYEAERSPSVSLASDSTDCSGPAVDRDQQMLLSAALVDNLSSSCPSVPILSQRNLTQLSKSSSPLAADLSLTCPTAPVLKGPHSPPDGLPNHLEPLSNSKSAPNITVLHQRSSKKNRFLRRMSSAKTIKINTERPIELLINM